LEDHFQLEIKIIRMEDGSNYFAVNRDVGKDAEKKFESFLQKKAKVARCEANLHCVKEELKTFLVGSSKEIVTVSQNNRTDHRNSFVSSVTQNTEVAYANIPGLKEAILKDLLDLKDNEKTECGLVIHIGEIFSMDLPGEYQLDKIIIPSIKHETFEKERINLAKIKTAINKNNTIIRYDIKIYTPEPEICIFLKLYLQNTADCGLRFVTFQEDDFFPIRVGYCYIGMLGDCIGKITIADPLTSK